MQTLIRVRVGPRLCVANNLPGDTDFLVLGPHVEYQVSALKLKGRLVPGVMEVLTPLTWQGAETVFGLIGPSAMSQ